MKEIDFANQLRELKSILREALLLLPAIQRGEKEAELNEHFNHSCQIIFSNDFYQNIWDECALLQLQRLFQVKRPSEKVYGRQLSAIAERIRDVQRINDFFFSILGNELSIEEVCNRLSAFTNIGTSVCLKLQASSHLQDIRESKSPASEKIEAFIEHVINDLGLNLIEAEDDLRQVITSIRVQETPGRVNALLINTASNVGILIPLSIRLQPGKGEVNCLVSGGSDFKIAIDRARLALVGNDFLSSTDNVECSLDITEANYSGDSIGLAAAVAMYSAATKYYIDPYTAITGNINLVGNQYKITSVKGVRAKLDAALLTGCRRIFIPKENQLEIGGEFSGRLYIVYVNDITDMLLKLLVKLEPLPGDTLQIRKINLLQAYCQDKGWYLSHPESIQDGLQFIISPPHPPELKINISNTGIHSPKTHQIIDFQELLNQLLILDEPKIPIQEVVKKPFLIKDSELRRQIRGKLEKLRPAKSREEQYCEYSYRFENGKEKIFIKQFTNGKLLLQGSAGGLYKKVLDIIIPLYNTKNPKAQLSFDDYLRYETEESSSLKKETLKPLRANIPLPHIGTDESGKGDYFGPMVIAGVCINESIKAKLEAIGIKDSKLLSDKRCRELATRIRMICNGRFEEVEVSPERYNELYDQFKKEGKNLNYLLAWGHARAIESILEKNPCSHAIADQFGDEKFILSKLMEKGKGLELVQTPKGERYIAVAAASILARDRFLSRIDKLSQEYGVVLPKGSSDIVIQPARQIIEKKGAEELRKVAKLHHKTTQKILEKIQT